MPLHLLGKKSWNVYNAANIERVRRDEAAAAAREEAEEQRMQEVDAARRLAVLRGQTAPPLEDTDKRLDERTAPLTSRYHGSGGDSEGQRRKRKRHGEDDTEFEMRLVIERNEPRPPALETLKRVTTSSAPIFDHRGHIDLFGDERARAHAEKNDEAEGKKKETKKAYEDQHTMRFANAAERDGPSNPWYSQVDPRAAAALSLSKDVWGNDDPSRKERDAQRTVTNDPLAIMKLGASRVREIKVERKKLQAEQMEEVRKLESEQREDRRQRRRERYGREERRHAEKARHRERSRERHRKRASPDQPGHLLHRRNHYEAEHRGTRKKDDNEGSERPSSRERRNGRSRPHRNPAGTGREEGRH